MAYEEKILVISGPSGVGKTFSVRYLENNFPFKRVIPTTTRRKRKVELEGEDYFFVTEEEFLLKLNNNELLFWSQIFGYWYGYELCSLEKIRASNLIPIFEVYTPLITSFTELFPRAFKIFLVPKSLDFLEQRMRLRGDSEDQICRRLKSAEVELNYFFNFLPRDFYDSVLFITDNNSTNLIVESVLRGFEDELSHLFVEKNLQMRK